MAGRAYYNECDPAAAAILRELIASDVVAPGDVDTRSIKDVSPDDLYGYTQCHFFAGGGLWSVAARLAGWPDERPLWTGSCPCQPFSVAGRRAGADDPRHLWPDFHRLIRAGRPPVVMGEQVAGKAGRHWFNGVRADLAGGGYAGRAVDIPACAVDAPHKRNRLYWIAVADSPQYTCGTGLREGNQVEHRGASSDGDGLVVHVPRVGRRERGAEHELRGRGATAAGSTVPRRNGSWWAVAQWIACHDGKARRTEPGAPLLVDGLPGRVDLWRVAGNAISPILAAEVVAAFLDAEASPSSNPIPHGKRDGGGL